MAVKYCLLYSRKEREQICTHKIEAQFILAYEDQDSIMLA